MLCNIVIDSQNGRKLHKFSCHSATVKINQITDVWIFHLYSIYCISGTVSQCGQVTLKVFFGYVMFHNNIKMVHSNKRESVTLTIVTMQISITHR